MGPRLGGGARGLATRVRATWFREPPRNAYAGPAAADFIVTCATSATTCFSETSPSYRTQTVATPRPTSALTAGRATETLGRASSKRPPGSGAWARSRRYSSEPSLGWMSRSWPVARRTGPPARPPASRAPDYLDPRPAPLPHPDTFMASGQLTQPRAAIPIRPQGVRTVPGPQATSTAPLPLLDHYRAKQGHTQNPITACPNPYKKSEFSYKGNVTSYPNLVLSVKSRSDL